MLKLKLKKTKLNTQIILFSIVNTEYVSLCLNFNIRKDHISENKVQ